MKQSKTQSLFFYSIINKEDWLQILDLYGFKYTGSVNNYYHLFEVKTPVSETVLDIDYNNLRIYQGSTVLKQDLELIYKGYLPLTYEQLQLLLDTFLGLKMTQSKKEEYLKWLQDKGSGEYI